MLNGQIKRTALLILTAACLKASFAGTTTGNLPVSAIVEANCFITNGQLDFGNYDPITANASSPLDASGTFQIACVRGTASTIGLGDGLNPSRVSGSHRSMTDGSAVTPSYLGYDLYQDPSRSIVWTSNAPINYQAATKNTITETVYGRIPPGQLIAAGIYMDTVTIVANF